MELDPVVEGEGNRTRWDGRYLNWYFSEAADAYAAQSQARYEAARAAYNDPAYQQVAEIRKRTATSVITLVEGT